MCEVCILLSQRRLWVEGEAGRLIGWVWLSLRHVIWPVFIEKEAGARVSAVWVRCSNETAPYYDWCNLTVSTHADTVLDLGPEALLCVHFLCISLTNKQRKTTTPPRYFYQLYNIGLVIRPKYSVYLPYSLVCWLGYRGFIMSAIFKALFLLSINCVLDYFSPLTRVTLLNFYLKICFWEKS